MLQIVSEPWWEVALKVVGLISILSGIFLAFYNRTRKQAGVSISKTESEVYKTIIENKLAEVNITEIIEKKVEYEIKPLKEMLWNREKEHYEVKREMQERLKNELDEKEILIKENEMLHGEIGLLRKEYNNLHLQFDNLKKEVDKLKINKNGK